MKPKLLAAALILSALMVVGMAAYEARILYWPSSNERAKGIVWHGHTFVGRKEFARWLRSRDIRYGVWARRHPSLVGYSANPRAAHPPAQPAAKATRVRQKGSDWSVESFGGGIAVLAGLGLVVVLVRRRRPGSSGGSARQSWLAARRAVPVAKGGARLMLGWAKAMTLLSLSLAKSSARTIRRRGTKFRRYLAPRAAPLAKAGAEMMLRWATATALLSSSLAASSANTIRRRRGELAWYLATALFAAGIGVVATVWLNRA